MQSIKHWIICTLIASCQEKVKTVEYVYPPTIIYPADCSEEDSIKAIKYYDSIKTDERKKEIVVKEKQAEGKTVKSTLDSLAKVVDRYISLRDYAMDSATWYKWEDSVKAHISDGQILMNQKVSRLEDVDNAKEFKEGFKVKPKK